MTYKYCKIQKIPFPKVEISEEEAKNPKECYVFEDAEDPRAPIVIHFPLVNDTFKEFKAPGKFSLFSWIWVVCLSTVLIFFVLPNSFMRGHSLCVSETIPSSNHQGHTYMHICLYHRDEDAFGENYEQQQRRLNKAHILIWDSPLNT